MRLFAEQGYDATTLADAIRARPAAEPPVTAVRRAMLSVSQQASAVPAPAPLWLFGDQPARAGLRRAGPRPLLRLEATITEAVLDRRSAGRAAEAPADPG